MPLLDQQHEAEIVNQRELETYSTLPRHAIEWQQYPARQDKRQQKPNDAEDEDKDDSNK